jgi:hypothetical protein
VVRLRSCQRERNFQTETLDFVGAGCRDLLMLLKHLKTFSDEIVRRKKEERYTNYLFKCNFVLFFLRHFAFGLSACSHLRVNIKMRCFSFVQSEGKMKVKKRQNLKHCGDFRFVFRYQMENRGKLKRFDNQVETRVECLSLNAIVMMFK